MSSYIAFGVVIVCFVSLTALLFWQSYRIQKLHDELTRERRDHYLPAIQGRDEAINRLLKHISQCSDELNTLWVTISKYESKLNRLNNKLEDVFINPLGADIDIGSIISIDGKAMEVTSTSYDKDSEDCDEVVILAEEYRPEERECDD